MEEVGPAIAGIARTLRDGVSIRVRPIRPEDEPRLLALWRGASQDTIYRRFFSVRRPGPADAHALVSADDRGRLAVVAETDSAEPELIGVAQYGPAPDGTADIGLLVADGWQGRGAGALLLDELLRIGEQRGIQEFSADVLTENRRTLGMLDRHTKITRRTSGSGVTSLVFRPRVSDPARAA